MNIMIYKRESVSYKTDGHKILAIFKSIVLTKIS